MQLPALQRLDVAEPRPVTVILGPERTLVDRAVERLVARVRPLAEPASFNVTVADMASPEGASAVGAARTLPMMASRRLVVLRGVEVATEAAMAALIAYAESPNESTVLVASGTGWPKVVKGGRAWATVGPKTLGDALVKFSEDDANPVAWARAHAASLGVTLGLSEARLLVDLTGTSLARLEREVEKLALLAPEGGTIEAALLHEATAALAEPVVWDLTTGLATRNAALALPALHRLLASGEAPHRLMALILWQLRTVLRYADLVRRRAPEPELRALRLRPEVAGPVRDEVQRGGLAAAEVLGCVTRASRQMNRAKAGADRVLEALVLDLTLRRT